jgi:nucleotide-binding universal stress UspA family protein
LRLKQMRQRLNEERDERMAAAVAYFEGIGIGCHTRYAVGLASHQIVSHLKEDPSAMLIMGKRGTRQDDRLALGTTVKRLLRHVNVPTLVVPPQKGLAAQIARRELPNIWRIISPTAMHNGCLMALDATSELASNLGASIEHVHVVKLPLPFTMRPNDWPTIVTHAARLEVERLYEHQLATHIGKERQKRCQLAVLFGLSAAIALQNHVQTAKADLMAIPTHCGRRAQLVRLGSTAEAIIRHAEVPVLVYPRQYLLSHSKQQAVGTGAERPIAERPVAE